MSNCTKAHTGTVGACPYCKRDNWKRRFYKLAYGGHDEAAYNTLAARLAEATQERNGYQHAADVACEERDEYKARLAEIVAAVDAWKRGENDAGGCIAECERIAKGTADSASPVRPCAACGSRHTIEYPTTECQSCGLQYTDHRAEQAREAWPANESGPAECMRQRDGGCHWPECGCVMDATGYMQLRASVTVNEVKP